MARLCRCRRRRAVGALAGQGDQPADRPEVLLAVAALQQRRREQLVERARRWPRPAGRGRTSGPPAPPAAARRPGRRRCARPRGRPRARRRAGRRTSRGARCARCRCRSTKWSRLAPSRSAAALHRVEVRRGRRVGQPAVPVVLAVDAHRVEVRREPLDLAQEVVGGEPALAEPAGQRVRRRRQPDAGLAQPGQQRRHQHRVTGVVELELVDAHQLCTTTARRPRRGSRAPRRDGSAPRRSRTAWAPAPRATARRAGGSCRRRTRRRGRPRRALGGGPAASRQPRPAGFFLGRSPSVAANSRSTSTAAACEGCAGIGVGSCRS